MNTRRHPALLASCLAVLFLAVIVLPATRLMDGAPDDGVAEAILHSAEPAAAQLPVAERNALQSSLAKLPLRFERNVGQTAEQVDYLVRG